MEKKVVARNSFVRDSFPVRRFMDFRFRDEFSGLVIYEIP